MDWMDLFLIDLFCFSQFFQLKELIEVCAIVCVCVCVCLFGVFFLETLVLDLNGGLTLRERQPKR